MLERVERIKLDESGRLKTPDHTRRAKKEQEGKQGLGSPTIKWNILERAERAQLDKSG